VTLRAAHEPSLRDLVVPAADPTQFEEAVEAVVVDGEMTVEIEDGNAILTAEIARRSEKNGVESARETGGIVTVTDSEVDDPLRRAGDAHHLQEEIFAM
jgi:hypothetical protein